jgi:hypothetical protein
MFFCGLYTMLNGSTQTGSRLNLKYIFGILEGGSVPPAPMARSRGMMTSASARVLDLPSAVFFATPPVAVISFFSSCRCFSFA